MMWLHRDAGLTVADDAAISRLLPGPAASTLADEAAIRRLLPGQPAASTLADEAAIRRLLPEDPVSLTWLPGCLAALPRAEAARGRDVSDALARAAEVLGDRKADAEARWRAAVVLGRLGGVETPGAPASSAVLVRALRGDPHAAVRRSAAEALGELGEASGAEGANALARACLQDRDAEVRWRAGEALRQLGPFGSYGAGASVLTQALVEASSPERRERAAQALGTLGSRVGERGAWAFGRTLAGDADVARRQKAASWIAQPEAPSARRSRPASGCVAPRPRWAARAAAKAQARSEAKAVERVLAAGARAAGALDDAAVRRLLGTASPTEADDAAVRRLLPGGDSADADDAAVRRLLPGGTQAEQDALAVQALASTKPQQTASSVLAADEAFILRCLPHAAKD